MSSGHIQTAFKPYSDPNSHISSNKSAAAYCLQTTIGSSAFLPHGRGEFVQQPGQGQTEGKR